MQQRARNASNEQPAGIGVIDLEPHHCRFPLPERVQGRVVFCGLPRADGKPYCRECAAKVYVPGSSRPR